MIEFELKDEGGPSTVQRQGPLVATIEDGIRNVEINIQAFQPDTDRDMRRHENRSWWGRLSCWLRPPRGTWTSETFYFNTDTES